MNLKDFENYFDNVILSRGMDYYTNGAVISLEKISEESFVAEVDGSEIYEVNVTLNGDEITDIECDCPYEYGMYCKHEAAVLYALRDEMKSNKKFSDTKESLLFVLEKCSKEQLIDIINEHTKEDKKFRNYLKFRLSSSENSDEFIEDFEKLCNKVCNSCDGVSNILKAFDVTVSKTDKIKNPVERMKIYIRIITILENCIEDFVNNYEYEEDSWELYAPMDDCAELMKFLAEDTVNGNNFDEINAMWECLYISMNGGYEYTERVFPVLFEFCKIPEYRYKLYNFLEEKIMYADKYRKETLIKRQLEIIQKYETKENIFKFMENHIECSDFRLEVVREYMNRKDYDKAEKLASDGESGYSPRMKNECMKLRHEIYTITGNKEKLKDMCCKLILEDNIEYYTEWKFLIPMEMRQAEIEKILKKSNFQVYEYIILEENFTDKIFKFCTDYPYKISELYYRLNGTVYEEQTKEIYKKYIYSEAKMASDRSAYKQVVKILKGYANNCGKNEAESIAQDFRDIYRRRPAFMDELKKAGF